MQGLESKSGEFLQREQSTSALSHPKIQLLQNKVQNFIESAMETETLVQEELPVMEGLLWDTLILLQDRTFQTAKGLQYTYRIKGNEMFVSRKDKSLTRATVALAFQTALMLQRNGSPVSGPKKLKTFGASYLYPIFQEISIIRSLEKQER